MAAQAASRRSTRARAAGPRSSAPDRTARIERRRRRRHLQRLRRDLLVDFSVALVLTMFLLIVTAGLGVVALLEVPAAATVITSFVIERRRRRVVAKTPCGGKIDRGAHR